MKNYRVGLVIHSLDPTPEPMSWFRRLLYALIRRTA